MNEIKHHTKDIAKAVAELKAVKMTEEEKVAIKALIEATSWKQRLQIKQLRSQVRSLLGRAVRRLYRREKDLR